MMEEKSTFTDVMVLFLKQALIDLRDGVCSSIIRAKRIARAIIRAKRIARAII
jgi:hypothetical protein